jgi:hypothetical protein
MQVPTTSALCLALLQMDTLSESNDIVLHRPDMSELFCLKTHHDILWYEGGRPERNPTCTLEDRWALLVYLVMRQARLRVTWSI